MDPAAVSPSERQDALSRFLERYLKRGYKIVSRSPTTAELCKPARFPEWLFREKTLYIDIQDSGWIYVRKA